MTIPQASTASQQKRGKATYGLTAVGAPAQKLRRSSRPAAASACMCRWRFMENSLRPGSSYGSTICSKILYRAVQPQQLSRPTWGTPRPPTQSVQGRSQKNATVRFRVHTTHVFRDGKVRAAARAAMLWDRRQHRATMAWLNLRHWCVCTSSSDATDRVRAERRTWTGSTARTDGVLVRLADAQRQGFVQHAVLERARHCK
jgi:hypothetical protein